MRVFKCLDHDQMVRSRICMSKVIDISNMLLSKILFYAYLMHGQENCKTLNFLFLIILNMSINFNRVDLVLNVVILKLSKKNSCSNPSESSQVCVCIYIEKRESLTMLLPRAFETKSYLLELNDRTCN